MNDKLKHFIAGFVICIVGYFLISMIPLDVHASLAGMLLSFLAGFLKELYDKFIKKTYFDWYDWLATTVGGTAGFLIIEIIQCW